MANELFIRIHSDLSVDWVISGSAPDDISAKADQPSTSLGQLTDISHGKKITVFIPGDMVLLGSHNIPVRNRQKILQAAPYAMEDDLIGDIEDFHFAIPARTPDKKIPICSVSRQDLTRILDLLAEYKLQPQAIVTDTLSLPWVPASWTILVENKKTTIRTDQFAGFAIDTNDLKGYIEIAIEEADDSSPAELSVIDYRSPDNGQSLESLLPDSLTFKKISPQESVIDLLASNYQENNAINLLQGEYAAKHIRNQNLKKWYPAAAVFILFLLVKMTGGAFEYSKLSSESDKLDQQINQIFRQSLPEVKRIVNPRAQMQQQLSKLKSSNQNGQADFFAHFSNTAKAIKNNNSIIIKSLKYRNNRLDIELNIDNLQSLEKLKQSISQAGSRVEIQSAAVQGEQVAARLRVLGGSL
ncbi:MAG: hypothetical protein GXP13_10265 [Gammaproteobacteria bacterium]|nr:hypothetical protein [Gammaproteobacteria bacterium]